jgi:hypothetical protein
MAYVGNPIDTQNTFQSLVGKRFSGDGSTTAFTLDVAPSSTLDIEVFVGNVRQDPNSAYTLSGTTLTFTGAPPSGTNNIYVVHQAKSVGTIGIPDDTISARTLVTLDNSNDHVLIEDATDGELKKALIPAASFAGIDDQTSSNDDQLTITDTAVVINEDSDDVDFRVESNGNANMLVVNAGGDRVGIGSDPDLGAGLHIKTSDTGASVASGMDELVLENGSANCGLSILTANDAIARIAFADPQDNGAGGIDYDHGSNVFKVIAAGTGNLFVQSDRVGIGTSGNTDDARLHLETPNQQNLKCQRPGTSNSGHIIFVNDNGTVGEISSNGSSTTYSTSSDYRLKENVNYIFDATSRLKQLKPARFNWIADDTNTLQDGFLAHEVSSIVPEAVNKTKDATRTLTNVVLNANGKVINSKISKDDWEHGKKEDEDGNRIFPADSTWEASKEVPDYQTIDESKLVPLLVKTVQELEARIKALEEA